MTGRVTVQPSGFQELILHPFSVKENRVPDRLPPANPQSRGHIASPCLCKVQGSLQGHCLSFLFPLDSLQAKSLSRNQLELRA